MAVFTKDSELKNFKLARGKTREWIKDGSTPYLYIYATQTQRGLNKTFVYRYADKDDPARKIQQITIGKYPSITLANARIKAIELTVAKEQGRDPKREAIQSKGVKFGELAAQWIDKENTQDKVGLKKQIGRINNYILPTFKDKDVKAITKADVIRLIDSIQEAEIKKGISHDTSKRTFRLLRQILQYATDKDLIDKDPAQSIKFNTTFKLSKPRHFKAITDPRKFAELLRAINEYQGAHNVKQALIFGAHTFLRSANVRGLKWQYVDFASKLIKFPGEQMKLKDDFIMPMSKQVIKLLKDQQAHRRGEFVFSSDITSLKPLSENTLNYAVKRLGFGDETVFHGLRSTASTLLHENTGRHGLDSAIIELCLDHRERDKVKLAYDRSQRLDERRRLMQWWSDYLDEIEGE